MDEVIKVEILSYVSLIINYEDLKDMDLIIEVFVEDMNIKKDVFKLLDELCKEDIILVINILLLFIIEIVFFIKRLDKVIGMYFFNLVFMMKLVEVISG